MTRVRYSVLLLFLLYQSVEHWSDSMETGFILSPIDVVRLINIEPMRRQHSVSLIVRWKLWKADQVDTIRPLMTRSGFVSFWQDLLVMTNHHKRGLLHCRHDELNVAKRVSPDVTLNIRDSLPCRPKKKRNFRLKLHEGKTTVPLKKKKLPLNCTCLPSPAR